MNLRVSSCGLEKMGKCELGVKLFSYKLNKFWESNVQHGNYTQ